MIVVPFCSLVPAVFIAHVVVGPIGWKIGNAIADVVYAGLTSDFRFVFAAVFGLLYAPVVMTGLHHMTNAIDSQLVSTVGGTILWPMIALSNIAQGSSVLAMSVLQRKNSRAQQINVPALISCYLGVTEPALFGVNLKYGFPLICGMIGSAVAAVISVGFGVQAISIGVGGLPGILSIYPQYYVIFGTAILTAVVLPFVLTYLAGKRKLSKEEIFGEESVEDVAEASPSVTENSETKEETETKELKAVLTGRVIPLEEVPDDVFSQKIMGDGVAIEPESNVVVAPADAEVMVVMADSGHACGLKFDNDMEMIIHVGIDTVAMKGDGFEVLVSQGDRVSTGTPLIRFDKEKIKAAGYPATTMVIITGEGKTKEIQYFDNMNAVAGETTIAKYI